MQKYYTGVPNEKSMGYCRAVKAGNLIEVAGTSTGEGENGAVAAINNVYEQCKLIFARIDIALRNFDASSKNIIRTRIYVTDISQWQQVAKAYKEYLQDVEPVYTLVEVSKLLADHALVEIEVTAYME